MSGRPLLKAGTRVRGLSSLPPVPGQRRREVTGTLVRDMEHTNVEIVLVRPDDGSGALWVFYPPVVLPTTEPSRLRMWACQLTFTGLGVALVEAILWWFR